MQIVSDAYKAYMSQPVRPPFHMEITVHTDTPIVYTDNEIFEFEEKKTAHPIGAELPTIEVSFKVDNIAGDYNADSPSGLYEQLIKGVKVTYRYGLEIPNVMPYGYPADEGETEEPIYGADPLNPYGFSPSSTIEWMDGGEVYTTGEISYDKTSATIEAVDALSFLEETADVAYGTINRKQCAQFIIDATEYPEDLLGAKKISIDAILETWNTNVVSDKNAKQVLQSLAHASGVQIYIDRSGYLHLDKIPITTGAVDYHVTLGDQDEDGEFTKGKTPRKVIVKVNTKNVVPEVSETINPKGEDILVENDFVQTTLQAEVVLPWVKRYLAMRNTAEIEYAGDPSLDILDIILLDTEYSENIPATIVESTIRFDGSITGSLVLRYDSALADNTTVKITGAENFIYSGETPSPASVTLVCETDMTAPSYEWSYFNDSSSGWQVISGATTANLTILADSPYIVGNSPTSFRVVVTGDEGTKGTTVRLQRVQEAVQQGHTYLGKLSALPSAYDVGDYFLVSTAFSGYGLGDVVQWDGDSWEVTTNPTLIVSVYQDALTLSMPLENTSAVNQYIRSIQTKQILLSTDTPIMFFYEDDTPYDGGQVATITATRRNVISGINWYINGDLVPDYDEDTIMVYDTDMSGNEIVVTAVSVEYASVNAVIKIAKKKDRKLDASNLGLITNGDPTPTVGKDGAPLVAGDYFMWGNPTTSTPDVRKKGAVYIYQTNGTWLEDTEGTKTMSMFAQFAELPNDTDSTVMGNTIIKNLVAIKAFIENLYAQNLRVTEGAIPQIANALSFDGSTSYVEITDASGLGFTGSGSVEVKCKLSAIDTSGMRLFQLGSDLVGAAGWGMRLGIDGTGHPVFSIVTTNPSPAQFDAIGGTVLSLDTEYVLLGVYTEGVGLSVSINGVLDGYMATTTTTLRHLNNSFIGVGRGSSNTLTNFFNGVMYYAKLWDGATQIAEWNMQTGYGSSLYDTIGSFVNNIYGATWIIDDETGFNFHALTDDGTGVPRFGTYYNGRPLFVVDPESGNIMFGNYNQSTKSGGILYDHVNDKLLGNVAYDQWDLVIESDADLALLNFPHNATQFKGQYSADSTGYDIDNYVLHEDLLYKCLQTYSEQTSTHIPGEASGIGYWEIEEMTATYKNVLVAPGLYNVTNYLTLGPYGVENFSGIGNTSKLQGIYSVYAGSMTNLISNIVFIRNSSISTSCFNISDMTLGSRIENINVIGYDGTGTGISSRFQGDLIKTSIFNCVFDNIQYGCRGAGNIVNCIAKNCINGFYACTNISSCSAISCTTGFSGCWRVSACNSYSYSSYGFYCCLYLSSIYAASTTGIGISDSSYISASYAINGVNNTKVDSDSCNSI